ncbi:type II secretion system secretin GspD [Rhodothalassium salexigens]|nr:type II secretion system secretin GspD [Rhodothalassium salexigens]MBB4210220.1 general secretion pathway protein D [Rhodothalassium salexigens DSM 2132]MBK1638661.1 type II secretion system protein GspD [Rhodothalassium salexigens DSM 2132]
MSMVMDTARTTMARAAKTAAAGLLAGSMALALWLSVSLGVAAQPAGGGETLNFRDADLATVIEEIAMLTGRTFIVDPAVRGEVTVISQTPLDTEGLFQVLQSTLDVNGFTAMPTASGAYKVVPRDGVARRGAPMGGPDTGDTMVTRVFAPRHIGHLAALRLLQGLVGEDGTLVATRGSDKLIAVDSAANVARMAELLAELDRDPSVVRTLKLDNTAAGEMVDTLRALAAEAEDEGAAGPGALRIVGVASTNSIVLKGRPDLVERYLPIARQLDADNETGGDIRVVYLKHAKAEEMASLLQQVANQLAAQRSPDGQGQGGRLETSIGVHAETNSLIVNGPPDVQKLLDEVISKLDIRRPQVLVEAIIVEMSDSAARELGLQYVLGGGDGNLPFTVTNFSQSAPNILAATGAVTLDDQLDDDDDALDNVRQAAINSLLNVNGFIGGFAGQTDNGTLFGFILNALDRDVQSNVLSTPSVMTLDNSEARINVGQEIPITTGEALGANNQNPFRTVERQDVGVILEVVPQISEGNSIRLFIRQEVSSVEGPATANAVDLITNQREIETTVLADDGEIIVLGGLIEDDERVTVDAVPLLGDIPGLGRLFRSEGRSRQRTNLMVFLRPSIVRGVEDVRRVTDQKYNYIRSEQIRRSGDGQSTLDLFTDQVLTPDAAAREQP